jgi:hypothetical protein
MIYETVGRAVLRFAYRYVRTRYRRQIRIGIGLGVTGLAVAAYLGSRNVPEG